MTTIQEEITAFMQKIQALGYAVAVFTPEQLRDADPREVEYHMITEGADTIDYLTEE